MKRKRNTVDVRGNFLDKDLNFEQDERLNRRLKRRCAAMKTFKNRGPNAAVEGNLKNAQKREVQVDPDYALYLTLCGGRADDYEDDDGDDVVVDDNDYDQDYLMCLKHLKEYGDSYILEIAVNDGMPLLVTYEEDGEFIDDDLNRKSLKNSKDVPSGGKVKTKQVLRNISFDKKKKESPKTLRSVPSKGRKIPMTKKGANAACRAKGSARQKPHLKVCYSSMPETKHDMGSVTEDDSYVNFLSRLKVEGETLVFVIEDGKQIIYEDDENASDSDSVIEAMDKDPHCDEGISPFVPSKVYYLDCKESSSRISSKFREKLMDILRKPFDKKEYDELLQEASDRKPLERHIEFRSGVTKRCPILESLSKSYLDHYTDLRKEIDSVNRSHYKVLILLRGFFYWLKNLSQEGAFRPWLDESCLKLIRRL